MLKKGIHMTEAKQNPCEAMIGEIGYAEPDTWFVICEHDAAPWYNKSKFKGKTLVISSFFWTRSMRNTFKRLLHLCLLISFTFRLNMNYFRNKSSEEINPKLLMIMVTI
jgi:hypothetical protein